ncbi:hypothetical protein EG329_011425 [Mollisiaceae sp. DMI_Dod_QoI]|nr:hypothetical protein EG329_011425 [Helotiales sp. DMI_Dod_QoI]
MAANIFSPLVDDLVGIIDTFTQTAGILDPENSQHSTLASEKSPLHDHRAPLRQVQIHVEPQHSSDSAEDGPSTLNEAKVEIIMIDNEQESEQQTPQPEPEGRSHASKAVLDDITSEVQILRDAIQDPVQAINALISMYILQSFEEPLLRLLTPNQCAQLFQAVYLADIASELDKQIHVLKAIADDHERESDAHLELVKDIKSRLVDTLTNVRSFALQHAKARISDQQESRSADILALDSSIERLYTSLQDQNDVTQQLVDQQERTIIALKLFLEDKIERFQKRRHQLSDADGCQETLEPPRYPKDWPSATIPTAQVAAILLSSTLAHIVNNPISIDSDPPQSPKSGALPVHAEIEVPSTPLPQLLEANELDEDHAEKMVAPPLDLGAIDHSQPAAQASLPSLPLSPANDTTSRPAPHVRFSLPKLFDKRRDSAISLLSSTGQPEKVEIHEDEALPDSEASEVVEEAIEVEKISINQVELKSELSVSVQELIREDEVFEMPADGNKADLVAAEAREETENTAVIDSEQQDELKIAEPLPINPEDDPVEDLYSADDIPTSRRSEPPPRVEEVAVEPARETLSSPPLPPRPEHTMSHTIPFLSTHWPQRAWLQTVLSVLAPGPEPNPTSPMSPSLSPEALASPTPNPSSSEWYSRYDAWWSFAMRTATGDDDGTSDSTTTSTSEQSWGAGSRSTIADSIDV